MFKYKSCPTCKRQFRVAKGRKYCSDACKMQAYRRRKDSTVGSADNAHARATRAAATMQSTSVLFTCAMCGKESYKTGAEFNRLYCSDACKQRAYRERKAEQV